MSDLELNEAERLNRLWDAALGLDVPSPPDGLVELGETIAALTAADDAPEPDLAFLARLRREVLATGEPASPRVPVRAQPLGLVWPAPVMLPRRTAVRFAIAAIAAALLIAALSGGRWLSRTGPAPMVASAMASAAPAHPTAQPTVYGATVVGMHRPTVVPDLPGRTSLNQAAVLPYLIDLLPLTVRQRLSS